MVHSKKHIRHRGSRLKLPNYSCLIISKWFFYLIDIELMLNVTKSDRIAIHAISSWSYHAVIHKSKDAQIISSLYSFCLSLFVAAFTGKCRCLNEDNIVSEV